MNIRRIHPSKCDDYIDYEYTYTADKGIDSRNYEIHPSVKLITICVLVLHNGTTIIGTATCGSEAWNDPEIGEKAARDNALAQLYPMLYHMQREDILRTGSLP